MPTNVSHDDLNRRLIRIEEHMEARKDKQDEMHEDILTWRSTISHLEATLAAINTTQALQTKTLEGFNDRISNLETSVNQRIGRDTFISGIFSKTGGWIAALAAGAVAIFGWLKDVINI